MHPRQNADTWRQGPVDHDRTPTVPSPAPHQCHHSHLNSAVSCTKQCRQAHSHSTVIYTYTWHLVPFPSHHGLRVDIFTVLSVARRHCHRLHVNSATACTSTMPCRRWHLLSATIRTSTVQSPALNVPASALPQCRHPHLHMASSAISLASRAGRLTTAPMPVDQNHALQ